MNDPLETQTEAELEVVADTVSPPVLTVLHSADTARIGLQLPLRDELLVGRAGGEGLDLALADRGLSRQHLQLSRHHTGVCGVLDLGSKNGTRLEGRVITQAPLGDDAVLRAGGTVLHVGRAGRPGLDPLCTSALWTEACHVLDRLAPSTLGILLQGETGTGKEVAARRVHHRSGRRGAFEAVNCAAIPAELAESTLFGHVDGAFTGARSSRPGHFVAAHEGTLFLDEVAELSLALQAKLLRVVETGRVRPVGASRDRTVDVRLVAATHVDLAEAVGQGRFREDLYARLAGAVVELAPLRLRRRDILTLARSFFSQASAPEGITWSAAFAEALVLGPWPRNIRQLKNEMARIALLVDPGAVLGPEHLPSASAEAPPAAVSGSRAPTMPPDASALRDLLEAHQGRVAAVARALGRDRKQVYRWLARAGLSPDEFRS